MNNRKILLIAAAALAGSSIPPVAKLALEVVGPFTLIFIRFFSASFIMYFFVSKKELSWTVFKDLKWVAIAGAANSNRTYTK